MAAVVDLAQTNVSLATLSDSLTSCLIYQSTAKVIAQQILNLNLNRGRLLDELEETWIVEIEVSAKRRNPGADPEIKQIKNAICWYLDGIT